MVTATVVASPGFAPAAPVNVGRGPGTLAPGAGLVSVSAGAWTLIWKLTTLLKPVAFAPTWAAMAEYSPSGRAGETGMEKLPLGLTAPVR